MQGKMFTAALVALAMLTAGQAGAATCLTGNCHTSLTKTRFIHGPVAAEQAGARGCVACHVPAGKSCTPNRKGSFKPMAPPAKMCQLCHSRGTGTQHSAKNINCLKCHDPHGSDKNASLNR